MGYEKQRRNISSFPEGVLSVLLAAIVIDGNILVPVSPGDFCQQNY